MDEGVGRSDKAEEQCPRNMTMEHSTLFIICQIVSERYFVRIRGLQGGLSETWVGILHPRKLRVPDDSKSLPVSKLRRGSARRGKRTPRPSHCGFEYASSNLPFGFLGQ